MSGSDERPALLVDTYSLLFRAHYALPPMNASDGTPTSALYGFSVLLVKLLREELPSGLAFAVDLPGRSFRREQYDEYKAGRPPAPDPLREQIGRLPELLEATGAPIHGAEGFEADDVLATLARTISGQGEAQSVVIVSGDRDLLQVVDDDVTVLFVGRRGQSHQRYDRQAVIDRFGLEPRQLPDRTAFVGDASDNLPGLAGVGPKTAARWLGQHGDVSGVIEHIDELKPARLRQVVGEHSDQLLQTASLATLRRDVPLGGGEPVAPVTTATLDGLRAVFERYGFKSLIGRLDDVPVDP